MVLIVYTKMFSRTPFYVAGSEDDFYRKATHISPLAVKTFQYMFYTFKKGIYIRIKDSQVEFIPFCNTRYTNDWYSKITIPDEFYSKYRWVSPPHTWHANNGIFQFQTRKYEYMNGVAALRDMLLYTVKREKVPDFEGFINKRDHPILRVDRMRAYDYIDPGVPMNDQTQYSPILSMCSGEQYSDIAIPTWQDWANVSTKHYPKCRKVQQDYVPFKDKLYKKAVFRGSSTGFDVSDTNPRIRAALLSKEHPNVLDAGITYWNERPRIHPKTQKVVWFEQELIDRVGLVREYTLSEQTRFAYIVHIDGHTSAFRLLTELGTGSVVLMVESRYALWIHQFLKPMIHYIPIKRDLSDLIETIEFCNENPEQCAEIASNALKVHREHATATGIAKYIKYMLST